MYKHIFDEQATFIWGENSKPHQWWMFRKEFNLESKNIIRDAKIYLTSGGNHILHINGQFVARGPARSYPFAKNYDVIEILRYLKNGSNIILITAVHLEHGAVIVQLKIDDSTILCTDNTWKSKLHPCFDLNTVQNNVPLEPIRWIEERFDSRYQEEWQDTHYNDKLWNNAIQISKVGEAPFNKLFENIGGLLSEDIILPKKYTAIEWSEDRQGYSFRLVRENLEKVNLYLTEILSEVDCEVTVYKNNVTKIFVNGQQVDKHIKLKQGSNIIVCINTFAGIELLFETDACLRFITYNLNNKMDSQWSGLILTNKTIDYPFNIPGEDILNSSEEIIVTTEAKSIYDLPKNITSRLEKMESKPASTAFLIENQKNYLGPGCFADPSIKEASPRMFLKDSISPMQNKNRLLHTNNESSTILVKEGKNANFILDFGSECLGYIEFCLRASEGVIVDIACFEVIDGAGIYWMGANSFRYICRDGWQTYTSYYPRGFRYMSVTVKNYSKPIEFNYINVKQSVHAIEEIGSFECDDTELNGIFDISLNTAKLCMQDTYIDCPGHEQVFWVGDARITATINLINFGGYNFNQYSIGLVGKSLSKEYINRYKSRDTRYTECKYLTISAYSTYVEGGLPMWTFMWVLQCYEHYMYSGNVDDLKENFEYINSLLVNCEILTNERGLFDMPGAWNLIEWSNNDLPPYGEVTSNNAWLVKCYNVAAKMAIALMDTKREANYIYRAESLKTSINKYCFNEKKHGYVDTVRDEFGYKNYLKFCDIKNYVPMEYEKYLLGERISEQTNSITLICDCVPNDRKDQVEKIVIRVEKGQYVCGAPSARTYENPSDKEAPDGIVAIGSPFFLHFSLEALFKMDKAETALKVIKRDWGEMLKRGSKTCWETFLKDDKRWTRSVCHGWSAAPAVYLLTDILGIKPLEPGFKKFQVKPKVMNLKWIKGSVATPYGPIYVEFVNGNLKINAPQECELVK